MSNAVSAVPDSTGHFGDYGGVFVPETLIFALDQLVGEYEAAKKDPEFQREFARYMREYVGRPSLFYFAEHLTKHLGGAKIYLKREDLNHTGAHKINNCIGQALLCKRMGKPRVIAETGAGQHGVASATVAALFGLKCDVYMGAEDVRRQSLNVFRMKLMGANVIPVQSGQKTLKDALNEALRDWMGSARRYALHHRLRRRPTPVPDDGTRLLQRGSSAMRCAGNARKLKDDCRITILGLRRRRVERGGDFLPIHRR